MSMLDEKIHWYVIFVRAGTEERVAMRLNKELGSHGFLPFVPKKTCVFRRQGKKSLFEKICFPGYVFIESDKPPAEFLNYFFLNIRKIKEVYRLLDYGDKIDIAMRNDERMALGRVLGSDKRIDISKGLKEGDNIKITSGALAGNEGMIQRINKVKQEAVIGVSMFSTMISVSVGFEVIENIFFND